MACGWRRSWPARQRSELRAQGIAASTISSATRGALCVLAIYAPEAEPLKIPYPTVESLEDESEWLTEQGPQVKARLAGLGWR